MFHLQGLFAALRDGIQELLVSGVLDFFTGLLGSIFPAA